MTTQAGAVEIVGGTEADRERMAEISDEWLSAYERGDLDGIMAIMHPDATLMPHNQATSRGTADRHRGPAFKRGSSK